MCNTFLFSGINMRYLGKVTESIAKYEQLNYLYVSVVLPMD